MLDKSIRDIERERQGLQTQEKKLIAEIKKSAKQGQMVGGLLFIFKNLKQDFLYLFFLKFMLIDFYFTLL